MNTAKILVPFDSHSSDLKPLYHALALSERIRAKIFVLLFKNENCIQDQTIPLEQACLEMVHSACAEGMSISFHIAGEVSGVELFNIIKTENINLIVIGAADIELESAIKGIKPGASVQIIKVEGKDNTNSI